MPEMKFLRLWAALLAAFLTLSACQTELYSNLSETEANEMMGILLGSGIDTVKAPGADETYIVSVDASNVQRALNILESHGLPRRNLDSIGQIFANSGIVSSPFAERVRYIYALSEEVSKTLQEIDGILVARVHIVMPEAPELGQEAMPSSAAVFIKQSSGYDLEFLTPQIRRLVANSIEGMNYEDVTVILVEAQPAQTTQGDGLQMTEILPGLSLQSSSVGTFWTLAGGMIGLVALLLAAIGYLLWRGAGKGRAGRGTAEEEPA